jgi:hypothetical protein
MQSFKIKKNSKTMRYLKKQKIDYLVFLINDIKPQIFVWDQKQYEKDNLTTEEDFDSEDQDPE